MVRNINFYSILAKATKSIYEHNKQLFTEQLLILQYGGLQYVVKTPGCENGGHTCAVTMQGYMMHANVRLSRKQLCA